jgi:AcrR family transcriptional regulator
MPPKPDVSAERRTQIIQAALTCFARKGFTNTTMDDIVAESGLSKGSLYWYFDGKDDLFAQAVTSFFDDFGQETLAELEKHETASEKMRAGALKMVDFCREAEGLFGLFIEFWSQSERREEVSAFWTDLLVHYQRLLACIIEEGIRKGEFRPVDASQLVWAILAAYDGLAAYDMLMPELDLERISEVFVEALLSGLIADGDGRKATNR